MTCMDTIHDLWLRPYSGESKFKTEIIYHEYFYRYRVKGMDILSLLFCLKDLKDLSNLVDHVHLVNLIMNRTCFTCYSQGGEGRGRSKERAEKEEEEGGGRRDIRRMSSRVSTARCPDRVTR